MELSGAVVHPDDPKFPNSEEQHRDHHEDEFLDILNPTNNTRKRCSDNFPGDRIEGIKNVI